MKSPVPESDYRAKDPNPRGGLRGARGIAVSAQRVILANTERLFIYDTNWRRVGSLSNPLMGGVHDILPVADGIWVTCTSADLLLKIGWEGEILDTWEWRRDKQLVRELGLWRLPFVDRTLDYRNPDSQRHGVPNIVHLNAVAKDAKGTLLSFGRILSPSVYRRQRFAGLIKNIAGAVGVNLRAARGNIRSSQIPKVAGSTWAAVLLRDDGTAEVVKRVGGTLVPNHNLCRVGDSLVYNDTNGNSLVCTHLDGSGPDLRVQIPGEPGFVRGLEQLPDGTFLVGGQSPAAVYRVDLQAGRVIDMCSLEGEPLESVYGIAVVPAGFSAPPAILG